VNCVGVREALPEFALGVASTDAIADVELHVETCAACRKEAIDLQRAAAAFGYAVAPATPADPGLEDRVAATVRGAAGGRGIGGRRARRAAATLLAAAILVAAVGVGSVFANRAERTRLQTAQTALATQQMLERFGDVVQTARFADPQTQVFLGNLAATGRRGTGAALTIVSPTSSDQVIVVVGDLPSVAAPAGVWLVNAKGREIGVGTIRRLDTSGGATIALSAGASLDGYVGVIVRGARGREWLRGTLVAQAAVPSPTP
jgi:hypothetical protein